MILDILLQLHELLLQEPEHLQPGLVLLLLQHRGRRHGHQTVQVALVTTGPGGVYLSSLSYMLHMSGENQHVCIRVQVLNDMDCTSECSNVVTGADCPLGARVRH